MNEDKFFKILLAAIRLNGITIIYTSLDTHQKLFARAWKLLTKTDRQKQLPVLVPSPFTGRFAEWDRALIQNQWGGMTLVVGPYMNYVRITLSEDQALRILNELTPELRRPFHRAACVF